MGNMRDDKTENYFEKILEQLVKQDDKMSGIKEDVAILHEKMNVNSQDHQDIKVDFAKQENRISTLELFKGKAVGISGFVVTAVTVCGIIFGMKK